MASDTKAVRRYQAGVERALALFDAKNEWADYIAFLSRLLKALQVAPADAGVPSKALLAQHLAHCLSPALPGGVHQKALEVYECIFGILGQDGLSRDLSLYLPGFAHTLSFASLATRPWVLALYDDHILKLPSPSLRPALKALILSLLPGIEEENSEDFDRTLGTINKLRGIFADSNSESIFWQSFFLASITSPGRRAGALVYLLRYLPQVGSSDGTRPVTNHDAITPSVQDIVTPEPGLLFRCFATGLQDEQPLVQRGFLDLLVTHLPLSSSTLQKAESRHDLVILVSAAMSIVLRRDMGLNRRLWSWFLGNDEKTDAGLDAIKSPIDASRPPTVAHSTYFSDFGMNAVVESLQGMLHKSTAGPTQRARPFRLLVSLLDRNAVGGPTVDALFVQLIADLKQYQTTAPTQEAFDEVFRSASMLFDSIDPRRLTKNLLNMLMHEHLGLVEFIVFNFGLDDAELGRAHFPVIAAHLSSRLNKEQQIIQESDQSAGSLRNIDQVAVVLDIIVEFVTIQPTGKTVQSSSSPADLLERATDFYNTENSKDPKQNPVLPELLLAMTATEILTAIGRFLDSRTDVQILDHLVSAFSKLAAVLPSTVRIASINALVSKLLDWCRLSPPISTISFAASRNATALVKVLAGEYAAVSSITQEHAIEIVPALIRHIWQYLQPSTPQYHVEGVDMIWSLRSVHPDMLLVDSTIMDLVASGGTSKHPSVNFGIVWTHTRKVKVPQTPNGTLSTDADISALLRQVVLLVIDHSSQDTRWTKWMSSLPSLEFHFRAVIETAHSPPESHDGTLVDLYRIRKLAQVARSSSSLWKDLNEDQEIPVAISNQATRAIKRHETDEVSAEVALEILKIVHSDASSVLSPELIEALTDHLPQTRAESELQSNLLDTLHSLMSQKPDLSPPSNLLAILMGGIASPLIDSNIDKWITLLCNSIPTYSDATFFANLLKLTECFCNRVQSFFDTLKNLYEANSEAQKPGFAAAKDPERSVTNLLSGLEYILARAHTKILDTTRPASSNADTPANEGARSRTLANHRLTVVLCMQDAIKVCCQMWFWRPSPTPGITADSKSFSYMSSRVRSRTRRMLEHLLQAEPQECLETIMGIWVKSTRTPSQPNQVMSLLQTLDGARPKFMLPAIFNAMYSRTNPGVLDFAQRSTLSVEASAIELVSFLIEYVSKLEDDLLEEIWNDCVSFMRDVLANPMPHRQLLLRLLEFLAALCSKMENTTFGEQSKMRRELADLITRLFTAIFTIKPVGMEQGSSPGHKPNVASGFSDRLGSGKGIDILLQVLPVMLPILSEGDRSSTVFQGISVNITGPALRARSFPQTLDNNVLGLCQIMGKGSTNNKTWKKDLTEAFNDSRLFNTSLAVATRGWLPILRQLSVLDRNLFVDVTSRFVAPATAGIMFGVGASAARNEADKTSKLNLRRISLLLMAQEQDFFAGNVGQLASKIDELLIATPSTSPSSNTRGEIYLLFRAMILCLGPENLVAVWPVLDSEIRKVFEDMSNEDGPALTLFTHLQAAKLLDLLLLLKPEEFQLHEWLFITDTIDAIYPPAGCESSAAADLIHLDGTDNVDLQSIQPSGLRKPWLATDLSRQPPETPGLLRSFFSQLSIRAFEATYSLEGADVEACRSDVLADLFSDGDVPT